MGQFSVVATIFLLLATRSLAQAQPDTGKAPDHGTPARAFSESVHAAPGGGEMVILAPERQYVIRAKTGKSGGVRVGCVRDAGVGEKDAASK